MQSWKEKRNEIEAQAQNLTDYISKAGNFSVSKEKIFDIAFETEFDTATTKNIYEAIMKSADTVWGWFW